MLTRSFESKYELGKKLGEGMHSVVYICHPRLGPRNHPLAVKVSREDDEEKKVAIRNEFQLTKNLDHPGVVRSVEMFENDLTGEI